MRHCLTCRSEVSPKSRFCVHCGNALPASTEEAAAPAPLPSPGVPRVEQAPAASIPAPPPIARIPLAASAGSPPASPKQVSPASITAKPPALEELRFVGREKQDDASDVVQFFVHFPHVPVKGHGSLLRLALENTSAHPLEQITVRSESRGLSVPAERRVSRIAPGMTVQVPLEIEPGRAGQHEIRFEVRLVQQGRQLSYLGSRPWRVLEVPDSSNVVVNISELQKINGASNAGLGADFGAIQISNLLGDHGPKTLNDLLSVEMPEEFQRVTLELDFTVSVAAQSVFAARRGAGLSLPRQFAGAVQAGTLALLTPLAAGSAAVPLRLTARPETRFGRSRADCDVVTWLLPRNEANDERTRHVSKIQAIATALPDSIRIRDTGSTNGTRVNGQEVGAAEPGTPLEERAGLVLGGEYQLECVAHASAYPQGPEISGLRLWSGPEARPPRRRGGVQFYPGNSEAMLNECLWLFTDAPFGSSRAAALVVPASGVAELQGRFHHFRSCFWVENTNPEGTVSVNGQRLEVGDIVPLVNGQIVALGATEYKVSIEA